MPNIGECRIFSPQVMFELPTLVRPPEKTAFSLTGNLALFGRCDSRGGGPLRRSRSSLHFEGCGVAGKSELHISTAHFQAPSNCFFQISTYFPWSSMGLPLESFMVNS